MHSREVTSGRDTARTEWGFFFLFFFCLSFLSPPIPLHFFPYISTTLTTSGATSWALPPRELELKLESKLPVSFLLDISFFPFFFFFFFFFFPFSILYFFFWVSGHTVAVPIPLLLHFLHTPSGSSRNNICNMPLDQRARTPASSVEIFNEW